MTHKTRLALVLAFYCWVFGAAIAIGACSAQTRAAVARTLADIAGEVCVEGDTISVCLKKCEDEVEKREMTADR